MHEEGVSSFLSVCEFAGKQFYPAGEKVYYCKDVTRLLVCVKGIDEIDFNLTMGWLEETVK